MAELPATKRENMEVYPCPSFETTPFVAPRSLRSRTVTLVSTAGLVNRGERPVPARYAGYRVIADDTPANDVLMSHVSVNFDRSGFQRDLNVVLPREPLRVLADEGIIGGVAERHYAFMGATEAVQLRRSSRRLAVELHRSGVDTALLLPV